jgi:putative phosphoserine phosphatase/1-acylglycerol-3-phosphate O-acyltransferase
MTTTRFCGSLRDLTMTLPASHLKAVSAATGPATAVAPVVVFLDLDRTLIAGYSIAALALETARHGARHGELKQAAKLLHASWRQRIDGSGTSYHRLLRRVTRALRGVSEQTLEQLGESAYHHTIARSVYSEAIALVETHREAGHHLVIISAASRYQVEPVARTLGINEICCTRLEVAEGRFTGQVLAPLCYGEGKALAARRVARRLRTSLAKCWFYTDSSADLPLLSKVGHPVAVNPSTRLAAHAAVKEWPQLHFSSRGGPALETVARTLFASQAIAATSALGMLNQRLGVARRRTINLQTRLLGDVVSGLAGLEFEVDGREYLARERPAIFIFNHQSLLDAMVIAHLLRRDVVGFCKQEMANTPLVGNLLRQMDTIFVDRKSKDQTLVLQQALTELDGGRSLVIAPEGTRSTLGELQPFKHGAFFLAKKSGVPVVPIVLHNMKDALPNGGRLIRPATIRITVLPPIQPEAMHSVRESCQQIEKLYAEVLGNSTSAALPYPARTVVTN